MPLSQAAARQPLHTRRIEMQGFRRDDGLYEFDAHLTDVKSYDFTNEWRGTVGAGTPVHDMWLRLTVTPDFRITGVEARTDASPYRICPDITPNFQRLVGLRIGRGWRREIQARLGGVQGCTHLVELLAPLATTVFQTIMPDRDAWDQPPGAAATEGKPALLDSCHALARSSPVVERFWPAFHTPAGTGDQG